APGNTGTVCRTGSGDACDPDEVCTGASSTCPPDSFLPIGAICRPAAGECDIAEGCGGLPGQACGPDAKKARGALCRGGGNPCSRERCGGTNDACEQAAGHAGALCRASAGECDPRETCTGTSTAWPADAKTPAGTACTDDGNPCSTDECDGSSDACQHPAGNAGTVCRPAADICDAVETCTGTSTTCPADALQPGIAACRASAVV